MRSIYYFLLLIFSSFSLQAQISLSQNDVYPSIGATQIIKTISASNVFLPPVGSGSNMLWDYSTITGSVSIDTIIIYDTSYVTGVNHLYPNAECIFHNISVNSYSFTSYSTGIKHWGTVSSVDTTVYTSAPHQITSFPIDHSLDIPNASFNYFRQSTSTFDSGNRAIRFYAEGTLVQPNGRTYPNCILIRTDHTASNANHSYTEYTWYTAGCSLNGLMRVFDFPNLNHRIITYQDNVPANWTSTTSLNPKDVSIEVYPIPASNILHIKSEQSIQKVVIRTLEGKALSHLSNINQGIHINHLNQGVYILEIQTKTGLISKPFVKQ